MGGTNQATCSPAPATAKQKPTTRVGNVIRFHESQPDGEVHFHDDQAKLKCAVESTTFFNEYHPWRSSMKGNLALMGHDGKGGHSRVEFMPYVDDNGDMQIGITVDPVTIGKTVKNLDKLAGFP